MKRTSILIILLDIGLIIFTTFTSFIKEKVAELGNTKIIKHIP